MTCCDVRACKDKQAVKDAKEDDSEQSFPLEEEKRWNGDVYMDLGFTCSDL